MKEMLLMDGCDSGIELDLSESTDGKGLMKFRGKFQEAARENKNRRIYSKAILDENIKRLQESIDKRGLTGSLDHTPSSIIELQTVSHVITKLWWKNNELWGEGEILSTPLGKVLKCLLNDGVRVGISSRGVGSGSTNENGILVINENYKLITFDAVADPSTHEAFQEKVIKQESTNLFVKNNSTNIHTLSKESVIAAIGGMMRQKTRLIKEGIY